MNPLSAYTYDLTQIVLDMNISPLTGYDAQIERIFKILLVKEKMNNKYNPLLLDLDGISRWRVMTEVARRMVNGEAPAPFNKTHIVVLDYEALLIDISPHHSAQPQRASAEKRVLQPPPDDTYDVDDAEIEKWLEELSSQDLWPPLADLYAPGEILSRLKALFVALHQAEGQVLLFVDHFHRIIGGERDRYPIDAATLLKPILARREMQLIGACTFDEYRQHVLRDAAIYRRLQEVRLTAEG